jgi:hypothetical protein
MPDMEWWEYTAWFFGGLAALIGLTSAVVFVGEITGDIVSLITGNN